MQKLKVVLDYIRNEEFLHPGDTKYYTSKAAFTRPLQNLIFILLSQSPRVGTEKLNQRQMQLSVNTRNENTTLNILHPGIHPHCPPLTPSSVHVARMLLVLLKRIFFFSPKTLFRLFEMHRFFHVIRKNKKMSSFPARWYSPQIYKFSTVHHPLDPFFPLENAYQNYSRPNIKRYRFFAHWYFCLKKKL